MSNTSFPSAAQDARGGSAPRFAVGLCALLLVFASAGSLTAAQSGEETKPAKSADEEWQEVKKLGRPGFRAWSPAPGASPEQARQQFIAALASDADKLKDFYTKHPTHAEAKEAKRLETLALLQSWHAGDDARESRRKKAVEDIRQDKTIPAARRSEVAAFADNIAVEKKPNLSRSERLAAYADVARSLTAEFPELPDAFEALVHIAKDSSDEKAPVLAAEVQAMAGAPTWIKKEAKAISDRYALIGKSVVEPTKLIFADNNPFAKAAGRTIVIYTWATAHPPSITQAKQLAAKAPANAALIGVCLDERDLKPAKARATAENLPGEQIYDWLGYRGEIAEALGAVDPGLVFLADAKGIVRSVSAQRDLAAAVAALPAQ